MDRGTVALGLCQGRKRSAMASGGHVQHAVPKSSGWVCALSLLHCSNEHIRKNRFIRFSRFIRFYQQIHKTAVDSQVNINDNDSHLYNQ